MKKYLNQTQVFTGEAQGEDIYLEQRIKEEMEVFGAYATKRFEKIHFGCGFEGRAKVFRDAVLENGGNLVDARPEFFKSTDHRTRLSRTEENEVCVVGRGEKAIDNLTANLNFKSNFLMPGGVRVVFPGAFGTKAEKAVSEEETDTAHRLGLDCGLMPTIIFNIENSEGVGFYQSDVDYLEQLIENQPYLSAKRNISRYVSNAHDAIALIEGYEALGYVSARDLDRYAPIVEGAPATDLEFSLDLHRLKNSQMHLDLE